MSGLLLPTTFLGSYMPVAAVLPKGQLAVQASPPLHSTRHILLVPGMGRLQGDRGVAVVCARVVWLLCVQEWCSCCLYTRGVAFVGICVLARGSQQGDPFAFEGWCDHSSTPWRCFICIGRLVDWETGLRVLAIALAMYQGLGCFMFGASCLTLGCLESTQVLAGMMASCSKLQGLLCQSLVLLSLHHQEVQSVFLAWCSWL
jgi:hypothetical protein